jgi:hypothetical protein
MLSVNKKTVNTLSKNLMGAMIFIGIFTTSCQSSSNKNDSTANLPESSPANVTTAAQNQDFAAQMQGLKKSLVEVLPLVLDPNQFNQEKNQKVILEKVHKMRELSKNVKHIAVKDQKDPSIDFIAQAFTDDLARVEEGLSMGKKEFARYNLLNVTAYCIECHTRTSTGPSFSSNDFEQTLKRLNGLERGEFLLATRQFDSALKEFSQIIDERLEQKSDFFILDKAVRQSLAITVKYLKDPKKSLLITDKLKNSVNAPYYLKQNALGWEIAIKDWMKEKPAKDNSVKAILKRCQQWEQSAQQDQMTNLDHTGQIYYLRALSDLHLILPTKLTGDELGQALYLAGVGYDSMRDFSLWNLHEDYYESCIRKVPHSTWSEKCYKRFEESAYFGFTGSSGIRIPDDVANRLAELKTLALRPESH